MLTENAGMKWTTNRLALKVDNHVAGQKQFI
jgi:hypothetical protein